MCSSGQRDILEGLSLGGKKLSVYQGFFRTRQSPVHQVNYTELGPLLVQLFRRLKESPPSWLQL